MTHPGEPAEAGPQALRLSMFAVLASIDHIDHYGLNETHMITQTSTVTFRQNPGEMLNQVQYRHESVLIKSVLINKDGKPVAALVDARLFERKRPFAYRGWRSARRRVPFSSAAAKA